MSNLCGCLAQKNFKGTNKIENLIVNQIKLGEPDDSGRRRPEIKDGSEFKIKADMVIKALGFRSRRICHIYLIQKNYK